jgi:hypothetical protein
MKKLLLAGVAGVALVAAAPANAADLGARPTYKTPPVVAPVRLFTWTGAARIFPIRAQETLWATAVPRKYCG